MNYYFGRIVRSFWRIVSNNHEEVQNNEYDLTLHDVLAEKRIKNEIKITEDINIHNESAKDYRIFSDENDSIENKNPLRSCERCGTKYFLSEEMDFDLCDKCYKEMYGRENYFKEVKLKSSIIGK